MHCRGARAVPSLARDAASRQAWPGPNANATADYLEEHFGRQAPPIPPHQPLETWLSQLKNTGGGAAGGRIVAGRPRLPAILGFAFFAGLLRLRGAHGNTR